MTIEEFEQRYMTHLNTQQKEAVQAVDGATLLLAVPGSGKTTVLVTRLGYMVLCRDICPDSILTMTYTKAATIEMKQRFASMFGAECADSLEFRTINGLSSKIIEYYSRYQSRRQPFSLIENEGELAQLISQIYYHINGDYATDSTIKDIRTAITYIKNMMMTDEEIREMETDVAKLPQIYEQYGKALRERAAMDYDDQMIYALTILQSYPQILEYFQEKFRYICVDESQDTSKIQHAIIRLLAQKYQNLFMVGDEDQSIFGFRAAYPQALLDFQKEYPAAKVLLVEQNYRSTEQIVSAANHFVSKNKFRFDKTIRPTRGSGAPISIIDVSTRSEQYKYLYALAQSTTQETAILYRNNDSALPLIDLFERNGIPYNCKQFDGVFFTHRILNDVTDIIHFAYDPTDRDAFMRIYYKMGSFLTKASAEYACSVSMKLGKNILEAMLDFPDLGYSARDRVRDLLIWLPKVTERSGAEAIRLIWNALGYGQYVSTNKLDGGKFVTLCLLGEQEPTARDLLRRLEELREITRTHLDSPENQVILSTIHSSKGLEYDRVYLLDVIDGTLPSEPMAAVNTPEYALYEEDRRLYYVGMTRAKNELYLFRCRDAASAFTTEVARMLPMEVFGAGSVVAALHQDLAGKKYSHRIRGEGTVIAQCEFTVLVEYIDKTLQLLTLQELWEQRKICRRESAQQMPKAAASKPKPMLSQIQAGQKIFHTKFEKGTITAIRDGIATIRFEGCGIKKFMLESSLQNGTIIIL